MLKDHTVNPRLSQNWFTVIEPYLFLAPLVLTLLAFNLYTFVTGAKLALSDAQCINPGEWAGLQNFRKLVHDSSFSSSLIRTFWFTVGCWLTQIPVALVLAVSLNNVAKRLQSVLRASYYVPVLINSIVAALMFRLFFIKDTGIINWILSLLGLPDNTDWLYNPNFCIPLLIFVSFWQWTGYHMVYLLAGLQTINPVIYEVARLDGATPLRIFFQIILPLLRPTIAFIVITSTISSMQLFDLPFMLFPNAGYGPGEQALTAIPFIYRTAFSNDFQLGYSAAAGWIVFAIIFIIGLFQINFLGLGRADEQ